MVVQDNATQWNSVDNMIEQALKLHVRINMYCSQHSKRSSNGSLADDYLSVEDWRTLTELHDIFKPFRKATLLLEGRGRTGLYGAAWEVLPTIHHLLIKTKEKKEHYQRLASVLDGDSKYHHIRRSLTSCIIKLQKYCSLVLQSPIYAVATVMNPTKKWRWLLKAIPDAVRPARVAVQQICDNFYNNSSQFTQPIQSTSSTAQSVPHTSHILDDSNDSSDKDFISPDPYAEYITSACVMKEKCKPDMLADWWKNHTQDEVSKMAWDTLCIPAMSAECERVLCSALRLIGGYQVNLKEDAIEATKCLKAWYLQDM